MLSQKTLNTHHHHSGGRPQLLNLLILEIRISSQHQVLAQSRYTLAGKLQMPLEPGFVSVDSTMLIQVQANWRTWRDEAHWTEQWNCGNNWSIRWKGSRTALSYCVPLRMGRNELCIAIGPILSTLNHSGGRGRLEVKVIFYDITFIVLCQMGSSLPTEVTINNRCVICSSLLVRNRLQNISSFASTLVFLRVFFIVWQIN